MSLHFLHNMATVDHVVDRVDYLKKINQPRMSDASRIRTILNGGQAAVDELLGKKNVARDLPVAHLMDSGLTRFAQKLRVAPDVRVYPRSDKDSQAEAKRAEKRQRIVEGYDHGSRLPIQLTEVARWLPTYGFAVWVIKSRKDADGNRYPHAESINSFNCYPGYWDGINDPLELAVIRRLDIRTVAAQYPIVAQKVQEARQGQAGRIATQQQAFADDRIEVAEYYDKTGTYIVAAELGVLLDWVPNPLASGAAFVMAKRPTFDALMGAYDHAIGLMSNMARLNMLAMISAEDATMRETNIIGEMESEQYERGRFAINRFAPGTQIERPRHDMAMHVFQQIDRVERQLRTTVNYSVIEDSQSPQSFATGQGLDRLTAGATDNVGEYQLVLEDALIRVDAKRLEWDERMYYDDTKPAKSFAGDTDRPQSETYNPKVDIAGAYQTSRVYGVMAGWDEPSKIVTGLQLLQAKIIDRRTMQNNLTGMTNQTQTNERIREDDAEESIKGFLNQAAAEKDPKAMAAIVEIFKNPKNAAEIYTKYFTAEEPEMSPEEQALAMGGGQPGPGGLGGGPPEAITTVLSRLEQGGGTGGGGVQTVGQL